MPQQASQERGTDTLQEFAEKLAQVPLLYEPGSRWSYSLSTDVCGYLVEAISGQSFESFLQQRLFEPLDMPDTGFSISDAQLDRFAACYERAPDKSLRLQDDPETSRYRHAPKAPSGAGGLVGTVSDYANFCEMLRQKGQFRGQQIIGRPILELMTRNHLGSRSLAQMAVGGFSETSNEGVGFGLGFASTIDAAASGTVGEGDFYWGGLASTLFLGGPYRGSLCHLHDATDPLFHFQFQRPDQKFGLRSAVLGAYSPTDRETLGNCLKNKEPALGGL